MRFFGKLPLLGTSDYCPLILFVNQSCSLFAVYVLHTLVSMISLSLSLSLCLSVSFLPFPFLHTYVFIPLQAYLHSRMRARTAALLKVLNRARPEVKSTEKKTITRVFVQNSVFTCINVRQE